MRRRLLCLISCFSILLASACDLNEDVHHEDGSAHPVSDAKDERQDKLADPEIARAITPPPSAPVVDEELVITEPIGPFGGFSRSGGGGSRLDRCPFDPNKTDPGLCGCNVAESDTDGDGVFDCIDNCPFVPNSSQTDSDSDKVGDVCDNCSLIANSNQLNTDGDTLGNACDNCPFADNQDQADGDFDNVGNVCDNCPVDANADQLNSDLDALGDVCDNCVFDANSDQANIDGDDVGAACDCDDNNPDIGEVPDGGTAFYVNPASGNNANNCLSPATPCSTIAGAVAKADDGDAILLAAGTYLEKNIEVGDDLVILGKGARVTTLMVAGSEPRRGFEIEITSSTTICGLSVTNGFETSGEGGGAILNSGSLTLSNVSLRTNLARGITGTTGAAGVDNPNGVGGMGGVGGPGEDGFGGAIFNEGVIFAIMNSTISNNVAVGGTGGAGGTGGSGTTQGPGGVGGVGGDSFGGGIFNSSGATILSIINSTISGNSASQSLGGPGGIGIPPGGPGAQGSGLGGGIYNSVTASIIVTNSTITDNSVVGAGGGGVNNQGIFGINHTIIANQDSGDDCVGVINDTAPNLDSDGTCGGATTSATIMLDMLNDNGGNTDTHALLVGSSAIDAGDPTCGTAIDQRGEPRPPNGGGASCDIGAYEVQP